jgi:hypothetical protein
LRIEDQGQRIEGAADPRSLILSLDYTLNILSPRPIPDAPVRTVSRITPGSIACRNASSFDPVPVSSIV